MNKIEHRMIAAIEEIKCILVELSEEGNEVAIANFKDKLNNLLNEKGSKLRMPIYLGD